MNILKIALRNMSRQKKRSIMLGAAIAFGILVMTLLNGFTGGLVESTKRNIAQAMSGHIYISATETSSSGLEKKVIRDSTLISEAVSASGLDYESISKRSSMRGTLIFGSKEVNQSVQGVDWATEADFLNSLDITAGSLEELDNPQALLLPEDSARRLRVEVGEQLLVKTTTISGQNNLGEFILIATLAEEGSFGMSQGYANLSYVNALINIGEAEFTSYNIYLDEMEQSSAGAAAIHAQLSKTAKVEALDDGEDQRPGPGGGGGMRMGALMPGGIGGMMIGRGGSGNVVKETVFSITTVEELTGGIESIVSVFDTIALVVFGILLVIVMVGITNSFRMILLERTREIGTLRAMGMQKRDVSALFLAEAVFIALAGAFSGIALALLIMGLVSLINFSNVSMLSIFLNDGSIGFVLDFLQLARNLGIVIIFSIAAAWFPAGKAGNLQPAVALRTQY